MRPKPRLRRMERSLSPTQAVLAWLAVAQRYANPDDFARSLIDLPGSPRPLDGIIDQVEALARARNVDGDEWVVWHAVRQAGGDAALLYFLAARLDAAATDLADRATVNVLLVQDRLGHAADGAGDPSGTSGHSWESGAAGASWAQWSAVGREIVCDVRVEDMTRRVLERDYFRSHTTLFPDTAAEWRRLQTAIEGLDRLMNAVPTGSARGRASTSATDDTEMAPEALEARIVARARDLVDDARIAAFEYLGRPDAAYAIATARLRARPRVSPG